MAKTPLVSSKLDLGFTHKDSEISYDPSNTFHQVTFSYAFEKELHDFIDSLVSLCFTDEKFRDFGALPADTNMTSLYFDMLRDFPRLPWESYNRWYYERKARFAGVFRELIINSINTEKDSGIKGFEFFTWASATTLTALMTDEYFMKHFEKLKIMKETLLYIIARALETVFYEVYTDSFVDKYRAEKTGTDKRRIEPLTSRYVLVYYDLADRTHIEKMIFSRDAVLLIERETANSLMQVFEAVTAASKRVERKDTPFNLYADYQNIRFILAGKKEKKMFVRLCRKDRALSRRLTAHRERKMILKAVTALAAAGPSQELLNVIRHPEVISDMFEEKKALAYLLKALKSMKKPDADSLAAKAREACSRVERSANRIFNTLSGGSFEKALASAAEDFSLHLRMIKEYTEIRKRFGRRSAYGEELSGIKIMRQGEIRAVLDENTGLSGDELLPIPTDKKTRIENLFEEGNIFYMRPDGAMCASAEGAKRGKKFFMFADLRNSTETTMKLTKDTAGFLTPYLNTVYSVSKSQSGAEIYFAGDGYAAHFNSAADCVRTCYMIHAEFAKLRRDAADKLKQKEKELFKKLVQGKIIDEHYTVKITGAPAEGCGEDVLDFIRLAEKNPGINVMDAVNLVAKEYSMPMVEIGIGITMGELFVAVIGEGEVRFNIVLSPSLTQAARISGSNNEVKAYLEKLYGIKNMPRKAYAREKKLFNQGIVITAEVFDSLRKEVQMEAVAGKSAGLSFDSYYYFDSVVNRHICMSKLEDSIVLKGIEGEVEVFEVFTPAAQTDGFINDYLKKR